MKIKIFTICFLIIVISASVNAQGFTFDKEKYEQRDVVEGLRGPMPTSVSFKKYTPYIYPQDNSSCVAQSFANAMAILFAKQLGNVNKEDISMLRPSPFFVYYTNKLSSDYNCNVGLDAELTAINLLKYGVVPMMMVEYPNYYPFTNIVLCNKYPPVYEDDLRQAVKVKPTNIYRIQNLMDIKAALASGLPVVVGMMTPASFTNCKSYLWTPASTDNMNNSYGHAMTIIGYNDNIYGGSFEVLNSWGEDWGINGYVWIRYSDAAKWVVAGWAVERETGTRFKYDGGLAEKKEGSLTPNAGMLKIFNQARQDSLIVNPFFQRGDLLEIFEKLRE